MVTTIGTIPPIKDIGMKVEVNSLAQKLINNPDFFGLFENRLRKDGPHRESTDIWARYGDIEKHGDSIFMNEHDSVWYPISELIPEAKDISMEIMAKVKGERLGGVLFTKLQPGGKVYPHTDKDGWHPNYYDKFYIPILNKKGATFNFDGISIDGEEGNVYWFRNDVTHWVNNDSDSDRIAMVVCIKPHNKDFLNV